MRKLLSKALALGLCALLLAGCAPREIAALENLPALTPSYSVPEYTEWVTDDGVPVVTSEQALADFDYMWAMLLENSPLLPALDENKDATGFGQSDVVKSIRSARRRIAREDTLTLGAFYTLLNESFGPLLDIGHTGIMDISTYTVTMTELDAYQTLEPNNTLLELMDNRKTAQAYHYLATVQRNRYYEQIEAAGKTRALRELVRESIYMMRTPDEIPIICVRNLEFADINCYVIAIELLHEYLAKCDEDEDLILDIRSNGGGNGQILLQGLLRPLLQEPASRWESGVTNLGSLTRALRGDVEAVFAQQVTVQPMAEVTGFSGNLWLLTDNGVAAEAADFVAWCNAAGLATTVGTPTGDGGGSKAVFFPLPNSGMLVSFEDILTPNPDGTPAALVGIAPEIENDKNKDAMATCLRLIEERRNPPAAE